MEAEVAKIVAFEVVAELTSERFGVTRAKPRWPTFLFVEVEILCWETWWGTWWGRDWQAVVIVVNAPPTKRRPPSSRSLPGWHQWSRPLSELGWDAVVPILTPGVSGEEIEIDSR